jgi:superfamily II DNA/RNA helicase
MQWHLTPDDIQLQ